MLDKNPTKNVETSLRDFRNDGQLLPVEKIRKYGRQRKQDIRSKQDIRGKLVRIQNWVGQTDR